MISYMLVASRLGSAAHTHTNGTFSVTSWVPDDFVCSAPVHIRVDQDDELNCSS